MNKILLALLAFGALTVPSLAADMPVKAPVQRFAVVDTGWAGMYGGINGGMNLGAFSPFVNTGGVLDPTATKVNLDDNNPFVGGHIGYLVQNGNFVLGPEVGIQYWGFKSHDQVKMVEAPITFQQKVDWLVYANLRAGFTLGPNLLAYATGGAAWAHVKGQIIDVAVLNTLNEQSILGVNIGAGLEYKITEYGTLGAEYRHYDFGKVSTINPALALQLNGVGKLTTDQIMGRLSYKLN